MDFFNVKIEFVYYVIIIYDLVYHAMSRYLLCDVTSKFTSSVEVGDFRVLLIT